ncbi:hypothetical protein SERLA73DRAFT_172052 [Serpula lacrymans var. lacrymans S7.3]|uniref:Uncharacterized protein n=2 Tax=Serpula lacrymans var. lacrymans TaxID=341189 RepID=F8QDU5_SERL3|nr:uncharacterized protein SERLADRAFT_454035 [Serpula lacrymans var. lacrymans S7.9]EGN93766.1 hypothetical protein SERLA73DRAFT_172052 [Serpula lacrymans var. lacrymans S7.3]EGO19137.1 hypothetical protein SERLADRAFT_454035 [Serpula lacrymans var. lacrymans S7.9]
MSVALDGAHLEDKDGLIQPDKLASTHNDNPQISTPPPSNNSDELSPTNENALVQTQKKKKKKKSKKPKAKESPSGAPTADVERDRASVLCISRNKHWRYISSYHGPWLQLPLELLESLLVLNLDPATLSVPETRLPALPPPPPSSTHHSHSYSHTIQNSRMRDRDRGFHSLADHTPPDSPRSTFTPLPATYTSTVSAPAPFPLPSPGKATPPPIDPGVFRSVTAIRRLIDEAAELSVRATSGLSAAALGSMRAGGGGGGAWAAAQALGLDGSGQNAGGRNVAMSAMRVHRLRALAVQKLALAYKADEIASSVMVMQGGSVFDDIAERVLKHDPGDLDARYVHFFHEKIPSRQLAESTTTQLLDELIAAQPQRLELYRTRGIVHCFRDEYTQATKDFTYALKESRAARKARLAHRNVTSSSESRGKSHKKKKGHNKSNGQAPPSGTSASAEATTIEGPDGEPLLLHPSVLPDAPDPIEPQLLFLRGSAFLQHAVFLIESTILQLEGIGKTPAALDGAELRLCYVENGRYGGVEIGNPDGPLGRSDGAKARAYRHVLAEETFREQIYALVRKSMRDHERFLAHFDTLEGPPPAANGDGPPADLAQRVEMAFLLTESVRPGTHSAAAGLASVDSVVPAMFTTYHPLLVESHFSILICQLMLMNLPTLLPNFARTAALVDGLEGYPVFLPPRSMAQAEFIEMLERLASGWKVGVQPHSLLAQATGRLAIEAPPSSPPTPSIDAMSSSSGDSDSTRPSASTSTCHDSSPSSQQSPGCDTPTNRSRMDLVENLDCMRMLLVPVAARQKERADKAAAERAAGTNKKKPLNINIPLHGPRVEIVLAWLAAVHLVELESVA